jgi:hypothetical protein
MLNECMRDFKVIELFSTCPISGLKEKLAECMKVHVRIRPRWI